MGKAMRTALLVWAALLTAGWPRTVRAQTSAADEVVVRGRREKELDQLLETLAPSRMGRQIARWDRRVCTRLYGLESEHAAFVKARIDQLADRLGIGSVKSPRCTPDILVIFALDADAVAADLVRRYPMLVGEMDLGAVTKQARALYLAPRPVRWLGQDWVKPEELPTVSRIKTNFRQAISTTVSVVDLTKLDGINWGQLADFLAFVSLSRPKLDHVYNDPGTILSSFTARDAGKPLPTGLTPLDRSFLTNLYETTARQTADRQRQDIRRHVKADLAKEAN
jgi:hypothetical protein